jgi:hypothetical protein
MVVGASSPVLAVVSDVSVTGGGGGAICMRKSQSNVSAFPLQVLLNFF